MFSGLKAWVKKTIQANTKFLSNEEAVANMHVADQIVELGVGAILVGGFELYGIQMIINATGLTGVVQTMFTTVLVILIVVADIYVFLGAARSASKTGK
jgi:hypothetical protein